jgi:CDP-diacylglycerol--serine O-phosphatidyltransferase
VQRSRIEGPILASLSPASWLTLAGGMLSSVAVFLYTDAMAGGGRERWFPLGAACMFGGLLSDALDGLLARRYQWESDLGRQLDSLCDAVTYLVAPAIGLRALGARGLWASFAMLVMIAAGLLRLARFNLTGNVPVALGSGYLGLPSYYAHFAFAGLVAVHALWPRLFEPVLFAVLLPMSVLFVSRRRFPKPKNPVIMFSMIGALLVGSLVVFVLKTPL